MTSVVIDSSAWIDFFRNAQGSVGDAVGLLVDQDRAVLVGPVLTELLQGTRSKSELSQLQGLLAILPFANVDRKDWEQAGHTLRTLRERGITLPVTDALIATVAHRRNLAVLTHDKHFDHLPATRLPLAT